MPDSVVEELQGQGSWLLVVDRIFGGYADPLGRRELGLAAPTMVGIDGDEVRATARASAWP
jgi:hypothetical protein